MLTNKHDSRKVDFVLKKFVKPKKRKLEIQEVRERKKLKFEEFDKLIGIQLPVNIFPVNNERERHAKAAKQAKLTDFWLV